MHTNWILLPLFLYFILLFISMVVMYRRRFGAIMANKINPRDISTRAELEAKLPSASTASDHFKNQFEMPVLFYVTIIILLIMQWVSWLELSLALTFVFIRAVHTWIHLTHNRVRYRFYAYAYSSLALWLLVMVMIFRWAQSLLG